MSNPAFAGDGFRIERRVLGELDTNVLLIVDEATNRSILIDAADDAPAVIGLASGTDLTAIVSTHGHWDHVQAARKVADALDVPVLLHPEDRFLVDIETEPLDAGDLSLGATTISVAHTPGHTPGSSCLLLDGVAVTGDTLFPGGPGATRFPYSSFDTIIDSITTSLLSLADDTVALPGHGDATTMGAERPSLPEWIDRRW